MVGLCMSVGESCYLPPVAMPGLRPFLRVTRCGCTPASNPGMHVPVRSAYLSLPVVSDFLARQGKAMRRMQHPTNHLP